MKRTLLALVVLELATRFTVTGDNVWYVDDIVDSVQVVTLCVLLASLVRDQILPWCIVVAYGMCETLEALSNVAWYWLNVYNPYLDTIRVVVALLVLSFYRYRRYSLPSVTCPSPSYMYITYRKPTTRQDRLLALFGVPYGGVGVYCRGEWYHYSRGRFIVSSMQPRDNHVMIRAQRYNPNVIERLNELVGTEWGLLNNCMTRVYPLIRWGATKRR